MAIKANHRPVALPWRGVLHALCGLVLILVFTGCDRTDGGPPGALVLNRGLNGGPESLMPHHFRSNQSASILRDTGEGLLRHDGSGKLVGGVAERWHVSADGLTYIFELRANARWSNGDRVVAGDFVSAFRDLVTPDVASTNANNAENVLNAPAILRNESQPASLGVYADGPNRLRIRLHTPTPFFVQLLAHPSMFPIYQFIPPTDHSEDARLPSVTNGAYAISDWVVGSHIELVRNSNYWNDNKTIFDKVIYHIVQESTELTRFRAGELDITANVPSTSFAMVKEQFPDELRVAPYLGVYYYGFNLSKRKFADNLALRRALSLAVDRELLVKKITGRGETAAYGWVPPGFSNYSSQSINASDMTKVEREALAIRLYRESGHGPDKPLQFELRYNTSDVQQRIALAIQSMWRDVLGVDATIVNEEFKVLLSNIQAQDITEVFRLSWTGDYDDPETFLKLFESNNSSNLTGYSSASYDDLMAFARNEVDESERRKFLEEAELLVLADHPVIPLYFYVSKHLISRRVVGWRDNILDIHPSQYLRIREDSASQ